MIWRVGMEIVCVDGTGMGVNRLTEGAVYTIAEIIQVTGKWKGSHSDNPVFRLCEVSPAPGYDAFASERFKPAVKRKTSIAVFESILSGNPLIITDENTRADNFRENVDAR